LEALYNGMEKIVPKHQTPNIGTIELQLADAPRKTRVSFQGASPDNIIFTRECNAQVPRREMTVIKGDTHRNRWHVDLRPISQMLRVANEVLTKLFTNPTPPPFQEYDEHAPDGMIADELSVTEHGKLQWPFEHPMELTAEIINVFDTEILVDMNPASGEKMKAVLSNMIRGVAVCMTNEHRNVVKAELVKHARTHSLVNVIGAPKKPDRLAAYEKKLNHHAASFPAALSAAALPPAPAAPAASSPILAWLAPPPEPAPSTIAAPSQPAWSGERPHKAARLTGFGLKLLCSGEPCICEPWGSV
jgi:hypothetical protein